MDQIIDSLNDISPEAAEDYVKMLFEGYLVRKKEGRVFGNTTKIPAIIILMYYTYMEKPYFYNIYDKFKDRYMADIKNFKERYIYNENKLEQVHSKEEQLGLRLVYDYIQAKEDFESINLYTLSEIHEILYSKAPFPEFGGKYRRDDRYLPHTGIDLTPASLIVHEMNSLRPEIDDIVKEGIKLGKEIDSKGILRYIDRCIELKCKLIKIHPFGDGNGRSVRAFINLLFKIANIPPVYIENKERYKYGIAMQMALGDEDLSKIKQFYYYKICDSIISLDINLKYLNEEEKQKNR